MSELEEFLSWCSEEVKDCVEEDIIQEKEEKEEDDAGFDLFANFCFDDEDFDITPTKPVGTSNIQQQTLEQSSYEERLMYFLTMYANVDDFVEADPGGGYDDFMEAFDNVTRGYDVHGCSVLQDVIRWLKTVSYEKLLHYHFLAARGMEPGGRRRRQPYVIDEHSKCICESFESDNDDNYSDGSKTKQDRRLLKEHTIASFLSVLKKQADQFHSQDDVEDQNEHKEELVEAFVIVTEDTYTKKEKIKEKECNYEVIAFQKQFSRVVGLFAMATVDLAAFAISIEKRYME